MNAVQPSNRFIQYKTLCFQKYSWFLWAALISGALILSITFGASAWASGIKLTSQEMNTLQTLETTLFTVPYSKDSVDQRLQRLEETVYGVTRPEMSYSQRVASLQQVLMPHYLSPPAQNPNHPPTQPPSQQAASQPPPAMNPAEDLPAGRESDYPSVTEMEHKIFGRGYEDDEITYRLERLEQILFNRVQQGSLGQRTDHLWIAVFGTSDRAIASNSTAPSGIADAQPAPLPQYPDMPPDMYSQYQAAPSADFMAAIANVEQEVLHATYPVDPLNVRLDRLENQVFHQTSPELGPEDRLQRLIAVASAGGDRPSSMGGKARFFKTVLPIILTILPMILL